MLWHSIGCSSTPLRTFPALLSVLSGGNCPFHVESTHCDGLKYRMLNASLVGNFYMNCLFSPGPCCCRSSCNQYTANISAVQAPALSSMCPAQPTLPQLCPDSWDNTNKAFPPRSNPCLLICNTTRTQWEWKQMQLLTVEWLKVAFQHSSFLYRFILKMYDKKIICSMETDW